MSRDTVSRTAHRPAMIEMLNDVLSREVYSFIGHVLASNPYVNPQWEADLKMVEALREDEHENARAILAQLGRYRAGPTLKAFRLWKEDLNFLGLDWLVVRAAEECKNDLEFLEATTAKLPTDDIELAATFRLLTRCKRQHLEKLETAAAKMQKERDERRAKHRAVTAIKVKGIGAPKPAAAAAGAPAKKGGGKHPPLPPGFKMPAVKGPPSTSAPAGSSAPTAPAPPKPPAPPSAPKKSSGGPPLPPGFKPPGK